MGKRDSEVPDETNYLGPRIRSYSVEEIMTAGGPTPFARKLGKNPANIEKRLRKRPKDAFLTDEEAELALKMLREGK